MRRLLLVVGLLVLLQTPGWGGQIYYASPNAPSANPCNGATSSGTPVSGLVKGVGCLGQGDTLVLLNGSYNECLPGDSIPDGLDATHPTVIKAATKGAAVVGWSSVDNATWSGCGGNLIHAGTRPATQNTGDTGRPANYLTFQGLTLLLPSNQYGQAFGVVGGSEWSVGHALQYDGPNGISYLDLDISGGKGQGADITTFTLGLGQGYNQQNTTIRNNYIHDLGADWTSGATATYGMYLSGGYSVIENNEVARVPGFAMHMYSDHGAFNSNTIRNNYLHDTQGAVLFSCGGSNNSFYNNIVARTGLAMDQHKGGVVAISCSGAAVSNNFIYHNTIVRTRGNNEQCIALLSGGSGNTIRNNLCWNNLSNGSVSDVITMGTGQSGDTIDTNLCSAGGCIVYSDPQFVATGPGTTIPDSDLAAAGITAASFQLQNTSPALGKGVDLTSVVGTDFSGQTRPQPAGTSPDLGAWEMGGQPINILPVGLYLYWKLDEASGTVAADSTANGHPGTLTGSPLPGHVGARVGPQGLALSGSGEHVETSAATPFAWPANQPVTLVFWSLVQTGGAMSLGTASPTPNLFGVCAPCSDGYLYWQYGAWDDSTHTGGGSIYFNLAPYIGNWMHIAVGADGNTPGQAKIWVNGQLQTSTSTFSVPTATQTTPFEAGRWNKPAHVVNGSGKVDDVRLYTQYLQDSDVQALYRITAGKVRHREGGD